MQPSAAAPATSQTSIELRGIRHAVAIVATFTAVFAWVYGQAWTSRDYLAESDLYEYFLPIFLSTLRAWSVFEFSGIPVFADPGESFAYPPFVLFAKLVGSWTAYAASAHVLAACGTYAYVYAVTGTRAAAFLAALAFGLSEAAIERLAHMSTLHTLAWMPFMFVCVERLLASGAPRWAALGALSTACVVLAGHPQPAIYACLAAGAYAVAGGLAERKARRYFVLVGVMFALGGVLAAAKLLPFLQLLQHMARDTVSFGHFIARGNTGAQLWTVLFPTVIHDGREAPTYIGLAPLVLALVGSTYWRRGWRIAFWLGALIVAGMFGIGEHSPLARFAFDYLPTYNKFRVGARHLIVASFSAVVLAGFGIRFVLAERAVGRVTTATAAVLGMIIAGLIALGRADGAVQFEVRDPIPWSAYGVPALVPDALWTQAFIALAAACIVVGLARSRVGKGWVAAAIVVVAVDLLNAQPFLLTPLGISSVVMPRAAAQPSVHAESVGALIAPGQQRALTFGGTARDAVLPAAWARLWEIPIAGGYGPMLLQRHSELSMMGRDGAVRPRVLAGSDQALDLLAVRALLVQPQDVASRGTVDIAGVAWDVDPLDLPVGRADCGYSYSRSVSVPLPEVETTAVHVLAHLRCAEHVRHGERVGSVSVVAADGTRVTSVLHAGIEISDASVVEASVRSRAGHGPAATVADLAAPNGHQSLITVRLPTPGRGSRLEVEAAGTGGWLVIGRLTAADSGGRFMTRSPARTFLDDADRWRVAGRFETTRFTDRGRDVAADGEQPYVLYENRHALPRAWLVGHVVSLPLVDVAPTIRASQLPDGRRFDPRETVLAAVEDGIPSLPSSAPGDARVRTDVDANATIELEVESSGGGFLVVSETYFPGWRATVNGTSTRVYRANYSLQGVVVPPGTHRVAFTFVPVVLYVGTAISAFGVIAVVFLLGLRLPPRLWPTLNRS